MYCVIASNLATWQLQNRDPEEELQMLFDRPSSQQEEAAAEAAAASEAALLLPVLSSKMQDSSSEPFLSHNTQSCIHEPPIPLMPPARPMLPYIAGNPGTAHAPSLLPVLYKGPPSNTQAAQPHTSAPSLLPVLYKGPPSNTQAAQPHTSAPSLLPVLYKGPAAAIRPTTTILSSGSAHAATVPLQVTLQAIARAHYRQQQQTPLSHAASCRRCRAPQSICTGPDTGKGPPPQPE